MKNVKVLSGIAISTIAIFLVTALISTTSDADAQPVRRDLDQVVQVLALRLAAALLVRALVVLAVNRVQYHVRHQAVDLLLPLVPVVRAAPGRKKILDVQIN